LFPQWIDELDAILGDVLHDADVGSEWSGLPARERREAFTRVVERSQVCGLRVGDRLLRHRTREAVVADALVVRASAAELRRGLVLGRTPRCDRRTQLEEDGNVSRVHALILAGVGTDPGLFVVDTASSNGTEVRSPGGPPIALDAERRIQSVSEHARIFLADVEVVVEINNEGT
jgi:hypothetical protein